MERFDSQASITFWKAQNLLLQQMNSRLVIFVSPKEIGNNGVHLGNDFLWEGKGPHPIQRNA